MMTKLNTISKKLFLIAILALALPACATFKEPPPEVRKQISILEPFKKAERILILAPHPDDESIGCAGVIQQALGAGAKVKVVYLTSGDHNLPAFIVYEKRLTLRQGEFIHMGHLRIKEAVKAMKLLGLKEDDLVFLGYPDFGTFTIFNRYWQSKTPFRDIITRISRVPYKECVSYGAPYQAESILSDLEKVILDYKPDRIFSSHGSDVNVDHKSFYLFLQVALSDLKGQIPEPKLYPYLVHCVGWPLPRHYNPGLNLYPPEAFWHSKISWVKTDLSAEELEKKYQAILCYRSQTQTSAFYLLAFARKNELFGDYPEVKLNQQAALHKQALAFFGASDMFEDFGALAQEEGPGDIEKNGQVSYAVAGEDFFVRVDKPKRLSRDFGVQLYLFGYSKRTTFALMPKVRIITSGRRFKLFLGGKRSSLAGVTLDFGKESLIIKIPLKLLGGPDYILASLKSYHGALPVDAAGFRKVIIE